MPRRGACCDLEQVKRSPAIIELNTTTDKCFRICVNLCVLKARLLSKGSKSRGQQGIGKSILLHGCDAIP